MSKTLVVLAAGMGSRYGGLKQLDPVGPSGEVVLDYSVHDAIRAGFDRVVFVIRREFAAAFESVVVSRFAKTVDTDVCFQDLDDLPDGRALPRGREKPWGTGHAIWAARDSVETPFLAVNADDFYGTEAFSVMSDFLEPAPSGLRMGMVAYRLDKTLSEHGAVSRGVCLVSPEHTLDSVEEFTGIVRNEAGLIRGTDTQGRVMELTGEEPVSMNFWGFTPEIFNALGTQFSTFLDSGGFENPKSEFYIPGAVSSLIASGAAPASVFFSQGQWFGVTYREDRDRVAAKLQDLTARGHYAIPLCPLAL